jgi:hypothetical protein
MNPTLARIREQAIESGNRMMAINGLSVWDADAYAAAVHKFVELYREAKGAAWRERNPLPEGRPRRIAMLIAKLKPL